MLALEGYVLKKAVLAFDQVSVPMPEVLNNIRAGLASVLFTTQIPKSQYRVPHPIAAVELPPDAL